jgi:hypothetical protein
MWLDCKEGETVWGGVWGRRDKKRERVEIEFEVVRIQKVDAIN